MYKRLKWCFHFSHHWLVFAENINFNIITIVQQTKSELLGVKSVLCSWCLYLAKEHYDFMNELDGFAVQQRQSGWLYHIATDAEGLTPIWVRSFSMCNRKRLENEVCKPDDQICLHVVNILNKLK